MASPKLDSQFYLPLEEAEETRGRGDRDGSTREGPALDLGFTVEWQVTSARTVDEAPEG